MAAQPKPKFSPDAIPETTPQTSAEAASAAEKEKLRSQLRVIPGGTPIPVAQEPEGNPDREPDPQGDYGPDGNPDPRPEVDLRTVLIFLFGFLAAVASLFFFSASPGDYLPTEFQSFDRLHEVYRVQGLDGFLSEKAKLREQVQRTLQSTTASEQLRAATNIAVYLFPELLSEDDFEKAEAIGSWARLERAIEQSPGQTESRLWFEDLRATVWNYENADRATPRLTSYARQVLRIYDVLSTP